MGGAGVVWQNITFRRALGGMSNGSITGLDCRTGVCLKLPFDMCQFRGTSVNEVGQSIY